MATVTTQKQLYESMMSIIQRTAQSKTQPSKPAESPSTPENTNTNTNKQDKPKENTEKVDVLPPSLGQPRVIIKIM